MSPDCTTDTIDGKDLQRSGFGTRVVAVAILGVFVRRMPQSGKSVRNP